MLKGLALIVVGAVVVVTIGYTVGWLVLGSRCTEVRATVQANYDANMRRKEEAQRTGAHYIMSSVGVGPDEQSCVKDWKPS